MSKKQAVDDTNELIEGWESISLDPIPISWVPVPRPENPPSNGTNPIHRNRIEGNITNPGTPQRKGVIGEEDGAEELIGGWDEDGIQTGWHKISRSIR